ncbi:hypothetical protein PIB30_057208 [Stylosanthes scabra]|uniref:Uncharacterized protein n=1 Tax=Stylosanthes scabra TaxID=79078 RepID=A0ABU6WLK1_9FABA|nr:hypothetical protein [Stylosanthes scabra]
MVVMCIVLDIGPRRPKSIADIPHSTSFIMANSLPDLETTRNLPSVLAPPVIPGVPNPLRYVLYIGAVCEDLPRLDQFTMVNKDEEGVAYTDHSGDEQRRDQRPEHQQEELDLNATANDGTEVDDANMDS